MDQGLEDLLKVESSLIRGASLFLPSCCSSSVDTLTEREDFNGLVIKLVQFYTLTAHTCRLHT